MHKLFDLSGKKAVVTCCATDIGQQIAEALAEAGADIIGIDKAPLSDVEAGVGAYGRNFHGINADLSYISPIPDIVSGIVGEHGGIDILIAYANEKESGQLPESISWDEYLHVVEANQNAIVRISTLAYSQMLKQSTGGKIVILSSALADRTAPNTLAYTITKNAVIGLMRTLAIAGAQHNIWVNAIAPGLIETSAIRDLPGELQAQLDEIIQFTMLGSMKMTLGKPENLRGTAVFLSSRASDFTVGQVFKIDGGLTSRI